MHTAITLRPATQADAPAIHALVRGERLNPNDLDWRRFKVATDGLRVIGAVQMRRHVDGARELGSLVVHPHARGRGLATRLVDALLEGHHGRVLMVTGEAFAARYAHWGFRPIAPRFAPASVRRNYRLGQVIGGLFALLRGRRPRRLVVLDRPAAGPSFTPARPVAPAGAQDASTARRIRRRTAPHG